MCSELTVGGFKGFKRGFKTPDNTLLTPLKPSYVPKALFWNDVFLDLKPENSRYYG